MSGKMKCFLPSAAMVVAYEQVFSYREIEKMKLLYM